MSGTVTVFIVIAVFCLLIGPILMLKPTPRQRQLANLRARGASLGLKVSTATLAGKPYTVYAAAWPEDKHVRFGAAPWTLVKKPYEHAIHVAKVWDYIDQNRAGAVELPVVLRLIERLPPSVVGLSSSPRGLSIYWLEKGSAEEFDSMAATLQNAATELWPLVREPEPVAPPSDPDDTTKP